MANKKISELPFISGNDISSTDLIPLVTYFSSVTGDTVHTLIGDLQPTITSANTVTYSQLSTLINNSGLTIGSNYLMTDFQTVYDQPNYDNNRNPIFSGNSMTGQTEPILLLSTSTTGFSPTVYSILYPRDIINYDITWKFTEVTNTPTKGRITERIDEFGNRTDYDHRNILFKRYYGYSYDESDPKSGLVGISGLTGTTGVLYGDTGTTFTSHFSTGSFVAVTNLTPFLFEVISVVSDSSMFISGVTISVTTGSVYYSAFNDGIMSYYQPNVRQNEVFEYTTFGDAIDNNAAINNYIGNYSNLYNWITNPFILANNVFITGAFINNTIGNNSYNNTFNDDCDSNIIGDSFYNNSTNDDFDANIIGDYFNNNYITANFNNNRIGSDFNDNILLGGSFYQNNIGNEFNSNTWTTGNFENNEIGNQFQNNEIYNDFYNNDIDSEFNNNNILGTFAYNEIGNYFQNNTVGDGFGYGISTSQGNKIGNYFYSNTIGEYFYNNVIADGFYENTIGDYFQLNDIKFSLSSTDFTSATHVYGDYNCTLFINSAPLSRLSYYDGSDVLTITNITD